MVVILLGPPGVGKGTQGARLTDELGWVRIATGDLLRSARREGTELGRKAQAYMDRGELVPDDLILDLVEETVEELDEDTGIVFDGFPRTIPQAEGLDEILPRHGRSVDGVVVLDAEDDVLVKRIAGRRSCPECDAVYNVYFDPPEAEGACDRCGAELHHREDDTPATVQRRLDVYREQTEPLIRYYRESDPPVIRVDGEQEVESVYEDVREAVSTSGAGA
jgi:adenylate kinase